MNGDVNGKEDATLPGAELWRHRDPKSTQMWDFMSIVNKKYSKKFRSYEDLYKWSIDDVSEFWEETWRYVGIRSSQQYDKVCPFSSSKLGHPGIERAILRDSDSC